MYRWNKNKWEKNHGKLEICSTVHVLWRGNGLLLQINKFDTYLFFHNLKPGIHDTSFASKSPFKKTWIQVYVYTMQEFFMNTHKFWREIQQTKWHFFFGEEGAALCIALLCTIVLRRRLSSKKRSTWARKWLRRRRWDVFLWSLLDLQSFH
jgi:hypothetical protein